MVVTGTFWTDGTNDDKYRKSLSGIGWTEEQVIHYDDIALEDHSNVCYKTSKKSEREIMDTSFECRRYSRTIESAQ